MTQATTTRVRFPPPVRSASGDRLSLYHFIGCPYCARVRDVIDELDLDVELRSIREVPRFAEELYAERGRTTVPVLRITSPGGDERWLPESADIVHYLEDKYR